MKKLAAAVLSVIMVMSLCGCNVTVAYPDDVVNDFFQAMKDKDEDVLILYTDNKDMNVLLHSTGDEKKINSIYDSTVKNLEWEIVSVEYNEDETEATVTVKVTNTDFSKVLDNYQKKATKYMTDTLYDDDVTKEDLTKKCMALYTEQVQKTVDKNGEPATETVTVKLTKSEDNYGWDMKMNKKLMKATIGGLEFPI